MFITPSQGLGKEMKNKKPLDLEVGLGTTEGLFSYYLTKNSGGPQALMLKWYQNISYSHFSTSTDLD